MRRGWFFFMIFCPLLAQAQTVQVVDEVDYVPVADVIISDIQYTRSVKTDLAGEADLAAFENKDSLVFEHPGFHKVITTIKNIRKQKNLVFLLDMSFISDRGITIPGDAREEIVLKDINLEAKKIRAIDIARINPQTTADMLQETGAVLVQKSQGGGGSPVIRGFEANRILLVVDGVRMNNAIYRSGHLQNAITVDNNILEATDIHFGPGSVMYGSDALGGVIHFHTKTPTLKGEDGYKPFRANTMVRYSSVNNERTGHLNFQLGGKKWSYLGSATVSHFGDTRMGSVRNHGYQDFGKVPSYVTQINGVDSIVSNSKPNLQLRSGYRQYDFLQKVRFKPSKTLEFIWNTQYSTSSKIPRFDRFNDLSGAQLKFAEWYYGPQNRLLTSLKSTVTKKNRLFTKLNIVAAYQRIDEDRINRNYRDSWRNYRNEDVDVWSLNADFKRKIDSTQRLFYGIEFTHNRIRSSATSIHITNGESKANQTRYPDGGSYMTTAAFYAAYDRKLADHLLLLTGARYSYATLHSRFNDTTFIQLPFQEISFNGGALSGSMGLKYRPSRNTHIGVVASTGFRSPNVDDYGKVFEKNGNVVVPNKSLRPEHAYNAELNFTQHFRRKLKVNTEGSEKSDFVTLGLGIYYTFLQNAIVRTDYQLNGQDSLSYDGVLAKIQTNTNANQAYIYGGTAELRIKISPSIQLFSNINYTFGRITTNSTPLGHIPPVYGRSAIRVTKGKWSLDFYARYNGWKRVDDFALTGEDNLNEATVDGSPPWYTLNLKGHITIRKHVQVQLGVENILDVHYKSFSSGISAPGRNLSIGLRTLF